MIKIIGGGTFSHVRSHMALAAPAFGETAIKLHELLAGSQLTLTKMADRRSKIVTNADVAEWVDNEVITDLSVKVVIFNAALCDFDGKIDNIESGKYATRLKTKNGQVNMVLTPADKVIGNITASRPDITVVGFKTTSDATASEQETVGKNLSIRGGARIVIANDLVTRNNLVIVDRQVLLASTNRNEILAYLSKLIEEIK